PAAFLRQRLRQPTRLLRVARGRHWTTDRLRHSDQQGLAGIYQTQGLWGICRTEQARRLERLAYVGYLACPARSGASVSNPHDYEVGFHDVRFGSKADICSAQRHVRFTPESDIRCDMVECPLWAKSGHWRLSKLKAAPLASMRPAQPVSL